MKIINSKIILWAWHVARSGRGEACTGFWWKTLSKRDQLRDPGADGQLILSGSSGSEMWGYGLD
jgi:hypothetical protein